MESVEILEGLTGCSSIRLVRRGNVAVKYALRIAKALNRKKAFIQDQGGWITYRQYALKMKMDIIKIKTDNGIIDKDDLKDDLLKNIGSDSVLLINSMPGYFALEDMKAVERICTKAGCLLINDISGSINTGEAKYGDIIIGSFGEDKPVAYGRCGFIAVREPDYFNLVLMEEVAEDKMLLEKLNTLDTRLENMKRIRDKVISDLKDYDIIHKERHGINIIVRFSDSAEKEKIINYCQSNDYEYTLCPRNIRVECDAVSIELKRLFKGDK